VIQAQKPLSQNLHPHEPLLKVPVSRTGGSHKVVQASGVFHDVEFRQPGGVHRAVCGAGGAAEEINCQLRNSDVNRHPQAKHDGLNDKKHAWPNKISLNARDKLVHRHCKTYAQVKTHLKRGKSPCTKPIICPIRNDRSKHQIL
jgi:hypothetical protein